MSLVLGMISVALRTGVPLPQITPCPLLDRFVEHSDSSDDYGLPQSLTIETLEDEQYLYAFLNATIDKQLM
jgi:hypothetical protein